ncbi:apolipophorins [Chelonus insularis]|uniref:apolipophorins n=1 Tax=Chelonus insularis TaxID=460826 RepID=UPI00158A2893|nr:apolipophorins [Chelonus insularis]
MRHPPRHLSAGSFIAAFLLLFAPSLRAEQCMTGCHGMGTSGGYTPGHTYIYEFEGKAVTSLSAAESDSTIKLNALVELAVKPDCIHQLKLKNVRLNGSPTPQKDIEQHALQFNYHNGHIDTSLCAEPQDSQTSLNIKRAIISMFQSAVMQENGVTSHRETDIFGSCQTDFEFKTKGDSVVVNKRRNLGRCSYRESMRHAIVHAAYDESSDLKSSPVLDSDMKMEQVFKKGVLNNAESTETYKYSPFSATESGAKTVVHSTLTLKTDKPDSSPNAAVSVPKSLVFEPPCPLTDSSADAITKALKAVKQETESQTVKEHAAEKFGDLIKVLRKSTKNHILNVWRKVKSGADGFDKNADAKTFLDALCRAGSGEAAEVMVELIKNKEISGLQLMAYYASLALIDHVNLPAVTAVTSLLDLPNVPRIGYMGIGRVIGKYCQHHDCQNAAEIKTALSKIASKIGNGKSNIREEENIMIGAMKALRNANYLDDETIDKLIAIVKDKSVHNRVRVAAVEALTAKCSMKWKKPMIEVFGDKEEDSEIRIKTYLSLVECACPQTVNMMKEKIDAETVNQVGSFVTTHLRNLRASTDPSKQNAKRLFAEVRPRTKFPEDFRKFSFNREFSYNIDTFGIGSVVEQNVIYSQKSFVPRSMSLNLTTELFGRSFNFLEIDVRSENVDRLIEHYFGPKGFFRNKELPQLISEGDKTFKDMYARVNEHLGKTTRGRRSTINPAELAQFAKNAKPKDTEVDEDVDIDLSIRMYGVELAYIDLRDKSSGFNPTHAVDRIFDFIDRAFDKVKNFDYSTSNHIHFMELDLVYPTGTGFPLSIGIEGNAVTHIKANGKLDIPAIMKDPNNAMVKIGFEPSANIAVVTNFAIEPFGNKAGIKMISRMHTATGSELTVKMLNGKGIDINFGIPKKKQEIISVSSEVLFVDNKGQTHSPKFPNGKEHSDCFDQFSTILGLTVCGHFSYPYDTIESVRNRAMYPLSGPAKFAISVENNDATSYHLRAHLDTSKDDEKSFELLFDTPNSKTNRKIALNVDAAYKPEEKFVEAKFDSPFKKIAGKISLQNTDKKKTLAVSLDHDIDHYYGTIGLIADGNKYKPILEYKVPEHIEKLAGGKGSKGGNAAYKMEGDIAVADSGDGKKYTFDKVTLLASDKKLLSIDGYVQTKPNGLLVDAAVSHNEENVKIKFDGKKLNDGFDVNIAAIPSKDPTIGFKLMWHYDRSNGLIDNNFVFIYGPDLESKTNRFTFIDKLSYEKNERPTHPYEYLNSIKTKTEITWPAQEVLVKLENHVAQTGFESEFNIQYGKFKIGSDVEIEVEQGAPHNWEVEWDAYIMDSKLAVGAKHKKLSDHKRKFEGKLEFPGAKYEVDTTVDYQVDTHRKYIQFSSDMKINGKNLKVNYGLDANPQQIKSDAIISLNNAKYLDFLLKIQRANNPNGKLNLNMKNIVAVTGQFNYQNGKGDASVDVDFPKLDRKMKGTGQLTVTGPKHVGEVEILLNADKDPSKRIKFTTDSEVKKNFINSKNVIEILSHKFEVNGKGTVEEKGPGKNAYKGEADITLPNGRYFNFKGQQDISRQNDQTEAYGNYELSDHSKKDAPGRKINYKYDMAVTQPKKEEFGTKHELNFVNTDGKDLQLLVASRHMADKTKPDFKKCELKTSAKGAYLPRPFDLLFSMNYNKKNDNVVGINGFWDLESSLGSDLSVKGSGKFEDGGDGTKPHYSELDVAFVFPSEKLRNLKYHEAITFKTPDVHGELYYKDEAALTYNDDKTIKAAIETKQTKSESGKVKDGTTKISLNLLSYPQLTLESSHKHDATAEMKKSSGKLAISYGDKKVASEIDASYLPDLSQINMVAKATTPLEKYHSVNFGLVHKHNKEGFWENDISLTADDKKYEMKSEFEMNPSVHRAHVVFACPDGKTELLAKVNKLSETEYKGEWKIDSPKGFAHADGHVKMDSVDNFMIETNFDSDKIKHRKIHATISTAPAVKTGKRIVLTVTSDGKNIITGSTNYSKRDEAGKIIVEGNGNLKIGENTRSSKFTYSRKQLTRENDGETGVAILLNANFGPSAVVGELKLSDKEVLVFNSYCEQSKDCAHFKLQSNVDTNQKTPIDHQITVEVDLKKFNVPVEFGLKTNTKYQAKEMTFDHAANLYLHTSKDKTQYSSKIYMHPKESAIILTLPSRELALIAAVDVPKNKFPMGPYKIDISAYLDRKNHPNDKTSFVANGDLNVEKNAFSIAGESRFIYPTQTKDMVIKGKLAYGGDNLLDANVDIDVFAKKPQKITIVTRLVKNSIPKGYNITGDIEITSRGQQLKVDIDQHLTLSPTDIGFGSMMAYTDQNQKPKSMGVLFSLNAVEAHLLVQAPTRTVMKVDSKMKSTFETASKNSIELNSEVVILDNPPVVILLEARDFNRFKYQSYRKDKPDTKFVADGHLVIGQVAEFHADAYKNGEKKPMFNIGVYLDESRFLKPTFGYNKDNVAYMIDFYRERIVKHLEQMKQAAKEVADEANVEFKDLYEHLKKAQPNWKPIIDYYEAELEKLKQELNADTTIKEIQATLNKVFGGFVTALTDVVNQLSKRMVELNKQLHEIGEKIMHAVKATYPKLKESFDKVAHAVIEITDAASKLVATYIKAILDILNQHQKEIKELISVVSELIHDIAKVFLKAYGEIENEVKNFIKLFTGQVQALPIYEIMKEKYQELSNFKVPDTILVPIEEAFIQLKRVLPTEELREFFTVTYNYIMKHLKHQKIDDGAEIKNIYNHAIDAIHSIIELLRNRGGAEQFYGLFDMKLPTGFGNLKDLPGIPVLRVSIINLLRNNELPSITDLYYAYRPTHYASDIIPPFSKIGVVVEGGHFFTYDGRHLTMPGTCDYVLAQDTRDGNFSVVGSFNNGKLISITIVAPGESITLKSNGNILVNDKAAEYPASTANLHAFLTPPIVNVKSDYGIHVACSHKAPMICSVRVSGFYHGRLRGLFGDANNEPYDDFTLPSGHITEKESEFGNAYRLNSGCAEAPTADHQNHQRNPTCTEYFTGSSSMSSCFNYVNPTIYRQACDHATSAGTPRATCLMSAAYVAACRHQRVYISIPSACGSCKLGKDEIAIGDSFSVKIPKKEADVIFVVEQDSKNEKIFKELITPLISELKNELAHHGITDVRIGLIGYADNMKWPQHYTTGGSMNIDGEVKNMNFSPSSPLISLKEAKEGDTQTRLKFAKQRLDVELGTFKLTDAYEEAVRYPFRTGAAKIVVGVIANPCEKSPLPLSLQQLRLFMGEKVYRDLGLTYYHVGYLKDILVSGKPQKNIVGYDADAGYTFSDKKKPLEGSIDKNNLVLSSNDVCAGFALSSGGAAFSSNHFLDAKQNQKKQFISIMARRLAEGITEVELNEDCVCKQQRGLDGHANCKIVGRKEKGHTKNGAKG